MIAGKRRMPCVSTIARRSRILGIHLSGFDIHEKMKGIEGAMKWSLVYYSQV